LLGQVFQDPVVALDAGQLRQMVHPRSPVVVVTRALSEGGQSMIDGM
jgi:hypothetical protein